MLEIGHWTKSEKSIARRAFELAIERELNAFIEEVRDNANKVKDSDDVWRLNDFLTKKRREIDEKYDYRYSVIVYVFARLIHEGWITIEDLAGLGEDKLRPIRIMTHPDFGSRGFVPDF
jgi:hypothetical protein